MAITRFTNPQGLEDIGANQFRATPNSGTPALVAPGTSGAGTIRGGTLEQSNVDISQEFINLISASTGFTANSRVMSTTDRLIQELLSVVR